jgi:hypothetical protein
MMCLLLYINGRIYNRPLVSRSISLLTQFLPESFARYKALSALLIRSSAVSEGRDWAMPVLMVTFMGCYVEFMVVSSTFFLSLSATGTASRKEVLGKRMANSSPP